MGKVLYEKLVNSQVPEYSGNTSFVNENPAKIIVVLDDDPTGCQTVHDIPILFTWEQDTLEKIFLDNTHLFFILTNTRSMPEKQAVTRIKEVMHHLIEAKNSTGRDFVVISRSDSTLRGHYPAEPDAIDEALNEEATMHCLVPAFFQGGRLTCNNIHYVKEGDFLFPVSETPFAEDKVFGFRNSDLPGYIEEKTAGRIVRERVLVFSVEELRTGGPEHVRIKLMESDFPVCIVNALSQSDLDVFASGAWQAMHMGKKMLFRTGASFLNSFGKISLKEPLQASVLRSGTGRGGLIVVGSYVPKTSAQLIPLLNSENITPLEFDVQKFITTNDEQLISSIASQSGQIIDNGKHVLIYTSRKLVHSEGTNGNLEIGMKVSDALVEIVKRIAVQPSFLIAKGGITAHEIGSKGLGIKKATVLGQALPGVPVLVPEEKPDFKYIIFPGNVGDEKALMTLLKKLSD